MFHSGAIAARGTRQENSMAQNTPVDDGDGVPLPTAPEGSSVEALGTSSNSDSGSDVAGALSRAELESDSDASGTGERPDVERSEALPQDIRPDRVRDVDELLAPGTRQSAIDQTASDDATSGADTGRAPGS
jgi:hypothetical protein